MCPHLLVHSSSQQTECRKDDARKNTAVLWECAPPGASQCPQGELLAAELGRGLETAGNRDTDGTSQIQEAGGAERHKTTIFTDTKESSTVFKLKHIVEGILKRPPDKQQLYKDDQLLDDDKTLGKCGFTSQTAWPQVPGIVGLAF
ncbi:hypothetical protein STEG23_028514 [Scotinomys teguina]